MEKLILRGVMWGADKVPDHWFEKVPGGFYKDKEGNTHKQPEKSEDMRKHRSSRRYSEDDDYEDSRKSRRDDHDDGYRSDGHGRHSHRSYDGPDDSYDTINDRPRRRRSRVDKYRNGGDTDRPKRAPREPRNGDPELNGGFSYHNGPVDPPLSPLSPHAAAAAAAAGAGYMYPSGSIASNPMSPPPPTGQPNPASQSTSTLRGGMATGYVPYANIYGQPQQPQYPPPASDTGSVQPNFMNQVAPPVAKQPYQQNPFAQEAPVGSQPSYIPDPYYTARRYDDRYDQPYDDRYDGYDAETERPYSRSPSRRHSRRDDYSPDSYDHRSDLRRARSERRPDDRQAPPGRGKSGIREAFDTSQKGLGYSAVGALAGGLVGSEIGKGRVPAAIGAAVGALGANAFQARERYVDTRRGPPLSAQMPSKPQQPPSRKKEDRRRSEYVRDEGYAHRGGKSG
ncbi:hypothetical protein PRZ48_001727 [Zasmidium cellare]|uniref:Glycine zipper 2TM domain-containing protein n=1 Tax=Zasmidium cellare TaxID=395010 RepID=A0ABR0F2A2_ZASCE|nr:hypothetical protein PRZ48_001727 [Zasmidium cellare]